MGTRQAQRRVGGAQQQQLLDTVGGVATVRAFGLAAEHAGLVRARSTEVVRLAMEVVRFQTRFFGRLNGAELVGAAARARRRGRERNPSRR